MFLLTVGHLGKAFLFLLASAREPRQRIMVPQRIFFLAKLPRAKPAKIRKKGLQEMADK